MGKIGKVIICMLCLFILTGTRVEGASDILSKTTEENNINIIIGEGQDTPNCVYGKDVKITINLINEGKDDASKVTIAPILDSSTDVFPFEIKKMNYDKRIDTLPGSSSVADREKRIKTVSYDFTTRKDVKSGYMKVSFLISYQSQDGSPHTTTRDIFVKTQGAPDPTPTKEPTQAPTQAPVVSDPEPEPDPIPDPIPEPIPESEATTSVPRVIVSGFTTEAKEVKAGEQFKLILHITNTSTSTKVSNLEFNIQSEADGTDEATAGAAFLPVAGSNTIFLNSIGKEETKDISIEMTAKADLAQKPYVINLGMKYEDEKANPYESESSVSIPVKQEARLEISDAQVMPNSIMVGSESNVMFSIFNTGKTKLYNVSVEFLSETVSGGKGFVGNIEPGETGNVDVMLTGERVTQDEGIIKVIIKYEDETGHSSTIEKEVELFVTEAHMDVDKPMFPEDDFLIEEGKRSKLPGVIVVILILAGLAVGLTLYIRRKKKMEEGIEDEIS